MAEPPVVFLFDEGAGLLAESHSSLCTAAVLVYPLAANEQEIQPLDSPFHKGAVNDHRIDFFIIKRLNRIRQCIKCEHIKISS